MPPDPRTPLPKRFYTLAGTAERDGVFVVTLDGRTARTPRGAPLALPSRLAAEALAAEWAAQVEAIDPARMPMTRIANSAIDGVARESEAVREAVAKYAASDLICYRAGEPDALVRAHAEAWDPVLAWARERFGARFILSQGVVFVEQPAAAVASITAAVADFAEPVALACLHVMTTLTGSVLLALAVAYGQLSATDAWTAAHVDEDVQMQAWGFDDEALRRRAARWLEMEAAAQVLHLVV